MTDTQQQLLTELVGEIARADVGFAPPRGMEERALKGWDENAMAPAPRIRRNPRRHVWLVPGVGALVAAALVIVLVHRSSRAQAGGPVRAAHQEIAAESTAVVPAPAASPSLAPRRIAIDRPEVGKRPRRVAPPRDVVSFVPLSSDVRQDLLGSFQVARVLLPREALADLGVVLDANRVGEPIQADVVFGEDGLARAIRLAPQDVRRFQ